MSRLQWTKQYVDNHVSNILKQQKDEKQVSHDIRQIFSGRGMLRNYLNQTITSPIAGLNTVPNFNQTITGRYKPRAPVKTSTETNAHEWKKTHGKNVKVEKSAHKVGKNIHVNNWVCRKTAPAHRPQYQASFSAQLNSTLPCFAVKLKHTIRRLKARWPNSCLLTFGTFIGSQEAVTSSCRKRNVTGQDGTVCSPAVHAL